MVGHLDRNGLPEDRGGRGPGAALGRLLGRSVAQPVGRAPESLLEPPKQALELVAAVQPERDRTLLLEVATPRRTGRCRARRSGFA